MADVDQQKAISVGEEFDVTAIRLNDNGDGVAICNGMTVFIPFLLVGEDARIRITSVEKRFARGQVVERRTASLDRQDAPCPVFGECGGCQVQHMLYEAQTIWKEGRIRRIAERLGLDADAVVRPIIGSHTPFRYRNQVQMPVRYNADEKRVEMGFFAAETHAMAVTDSCHLISETMQSTLVRACRFLTSIGPAAADVHHIVLRESATHAEQMIVFCTANGDDEFARTLARFHAPSVKTVAITVQPRPTGPIWGRTVNVQKGDGYLMERMGGRRFRVSPRSFLQVQTGMADRMYQVVLQQAQVSSEDVVIDAYCGIGTLTLLLASHARRVVGVEEIAQAIEDARENAELNRIENAEFHGARVEEWLPKWIESGGQPDVIVFDPPRKGIDRAALDAAIAAHIPRIVYVSCNPATLQRDLAILLDAGYRVKEMQPFDMFPQTEHVECVVATHYVGVTT
ncbi:23S rRNA (uracil-C(5))-methyltransferase RlmCD [Alicyclobacillus hesperidum]|uniref:23S rRNA (Uracil-C(5))-methyltransferase RlmCD n=1 Tax=Alicyclobacillus hesperidum TaxID=89784 RepID=A0A1H2VAG3_9BACL|nr:23S rRNA (uracil(1939)-C(5))-methyltransferase RlmD [Alicyclobacillus hesperidum]GLV14680.1 23S rRNA (uracil-C(5))-methyltransferase RlmCD [Alicyclobacillus hesperidum]SDW65307.1 23S rRNA m(5)U-1939 methyltransferase [Alicyclobacillus hesperidum]